MFEIPLYADGSDTNEVRSDPLVQTWRLSATQILMAKVEIVVKFNKDVLRLKCINNDCSWVRALPFNLKLRRL